MADYLIMKAVEYEKLPVKFKKAHPFEGLLSEGYWLQKKYDGCMGIATIRFERSECTMQSRTGEDYSASTQHILTELHEAACTQSGSFDPFIVIGEVWQPIEEAKFPAISGKFRRQSPSPELRFVANDILPLGFNTDIPYRRRWIDLCDLLPDEPGWKCFVAHNHPAFDAVDPVAVALSWQKAGGYDGGILRNADTGYTVGTVKQGEIIKIKPTMSLDLKVVRVEEGLGKHAGRAGALEVQHGALTTSVGTGLSDDDRLNWWAAWLSTGWEKTSPGANTIVEIEFLGYTEDGHLREPRFKGIRHDKVTPDA
jgi:ATP-dependent DNA ligase